MKKKILIIIPAYNEEKNIAQTIQEIHSVVGGDEFAAFTVSTLVINDHSEDNTAEVARQAGSRVVSLPYNLGIGGAVQTGFIFAQTHGYDIAVQMDGDNQHDPRYLMDLIAPVVRDEVDMTIGSRFLPPFIGYQSSLIRRIGIHFFSRLISFLTRQAITDPTSGFRAFNRSLIHVFAEYYPQDFPEPEAVVVAQRHGAQMKEIPVQMRKRVEGHSSIRYLKTLYYMIKVTVALLLDQLKARRERKG